MQRLYSGMQRLYGRIQRLAAHTHQEDNLNIEKLVVGALMTNCYIVGDDATGKGIVIDPGGDGERILEAVRRLKLDIVLIVDTHGHFDHIMANKEVMEGTGAPLAIHPDDARMLTNPLRSFAVFMGKWSSSPPATVMLKEGDTVEFGSAKLQVLHTPGHSSGSISLWCPEEKVVFSGDVLFHQGIGRTDFPGGSYRVLAQTIREKLFTLPDDTVVYSGHGSETTIGFERAHNPFVGSSE